MHGPQRAVEAVDFDWGRFKGKDVTIRMIDQKRVWSTLVSGWLPEFEALTGIKVQLDVLPQEQYNQRIGVASMQLPYSLLNRSAEAVLAYSAQHRSGVVTYSPMEQGLLAGRFTKDRIANLHPEDHRRREAQFQEPAVAGNLELVEGLRGIAVRSGRTVAQLAVAWVLQHPAVTATIVGARRPDQIEETVPAEAWRLTEEDRQAVDRLLAHRRQRLAAS